MNLDDISRQCAAAWEAYCMTGDTIHLAQHNRLRRIIWAEQDKRQEQDA